MIAGEPADPQDSEATLLSFQGLRQQNRSLPDNLLVEAAKHLAAQNNGEGFKSTSLEVKKGWRESLDLISVIYTNHSTFLGKGISGSVREHEALIVRLKDDTAQPVQIARKTYKNDHHFFSSLKANKEWSEYRSRQKNLTATARAYTNFNEENLTSDMHKYRGNLEEWRFDHPHYSLEQTLKCFIPAFRDVVVLQNDHMVHLDFKWGNMVSAKSGKEFHHIDSEDAHQFPTIDDPRSIREIQRSFDDFFPLTNAYTPHELYANFGSLIERILTLRFNENTDRKLFFHYLALAETMAKLMQSFQMGAAVFEILVGESITNVTEQDNEKGRPVKLNEAAIRSAVLKKFKSKAARETTDLLLDLLALPIAKISVERATERLIELAS